MLDHLLETGARKKKSTWGGIASAIVHGAVVCLAVAATAHANSTPPEPRVHETFIPWTPVPTMVDDRAAGRGTTGGVTPTGPVIPRIPVPGPVDIDMPTLPPLGGPSDTGVMRDIAASGRGAGPLPGAMTGPAGDAQLDTPVRVLDERAPAYPPSLRSAGITGLVTVQFVVDTTGRVELSSVRTLSSTHALFTQSVAASLRQARFTPGEVSGHRVRTLVERSFRFEIGGVR